MKEAKKERTIPKMIGSMSKSSKRLYAGSTKQVRKMIQEVEHFAKYTEYNIMSYDVQVDKNGNVLKPRNKTK